jgi:hypothetical protein
MAARAHPRLSRGTHPRPCKKFSRALPCPRIADKFAALDTSLQGKNYTIAQNLRGSPLAESEGALLKPRSF